MRNYTPRQLMNYFCEEGDDSGITTLLIVALLNDQYFFAAKTRFSERVDPETQLCPFMFMSRTAREAVGKEIGRLLLIVGDWADNYHQLDTFETELRRAAKGAYGDIFGNERGGGCKMGPGFTNFALEFIADLVHQEIQLENGEWPPLLGYAKYAK